MAIGPRASQAVVDPYALVKDLNKQTLAESVDQFVAPMLSPKDAGRGSASFAQPSPDDPHAAATGLAAVWAAVTR